MSTLTESEIFIIKRALLIAEESTLDELNHEFIIHSRHERRVEVIKSEMDVIHEAMMIMENYKENPVDELTKQAQEHDMGY